ncbi:hypothetical protein WJX79_005786 [Trebouxia sp. C0005]
MASYQWLHCGLPRYLRPGAHKLELKCHNAGVFQLMFTNSKHGKKDYLVSSSVYGEIKIWTVCPIEGLECIWLSGPPSDRLQSVYLQVTSLQHDSILAVADSTSIHLQTVSQMLHPAEGCMYPVQNPREGSLSLAWDSSGSLLAVCTAMGRLRLYHDQGRHCTLLDLAEHVLEVVFTPGDPSMMYCIRSRGISLLNLKALPECAAFCQAGEQKLRPTTAAYKGSGYQAAVLCDPGCVGPTGCEDPIASSWLPPVAPTPSVPQARTASRSENPDNTDATLIWYAAETAGTGHCSSIYVWDIRSVLGDAGLVPDTSPGGNHCNQLQFHDCTLTAVALSRCDTMMASTDASGKLVSSEKEFGCWAARYAIRENGQPARTNIAVADDANREDGQPARTNKAAADDSSRPLQDITNTAGGSSMQTAGWIWRSCSPF